ncbi:hypothetical protein MMC20_004797 [Loxospora ochrophaea]|nr:hypothetical protein [Loxospora ochrophaea]
MITKLFEDPPVPLTKTDSASVEGSSELSVSTNVVAASTDSAAAEETQASNTLAFTAAPLSMISDGQDPGLDSSKAIASQPTTISTTSSSSDPLPGSSADALGLTPFTNLPASSTTITSQTAPISVLPISSTPPVVATLQSTTTSFLGSNTSSPAPSPTAHLSLSKSAKSGIVIGVVFGVLFLLGLGVFLGISIARKHAQRRKSKPLSVPKDSGSKDEPVGEERIDPLELDANGGRNGRNELDSTNERRELGDTERKELEDTEIRELEDTSRKKQGSKEVKEHKRTDKIARRLGITSLQYPENTQETQ